MLALAAVGAGKVASAKSVMPSDTHGVSSIKMPNIINITRGYYGGEARFEGDLRIENGCVVAGSSSLRATPLFDADVMVGKDRQSLTQAGRVTVLFGQRFTAGSANLRESGRGWSIADIERFFGIKIPPSCPRRNIVRLHNIVVIEPPGDATVLDAPPASFIATEPSEPAPPSAQQITEQTQFTRVGLPEHREGQCPSRCRPAKATGAR